MADIDTVFGDGPPVPRASEVVAFWRDAGPGKWFAKDEAFDASMRRRFLGAHLAAARGDLAGWLADGEGALALMILLDQFPRNAFRATGHMFATDGLALSYARQAMDRGLDRQVDEVLRQFFYLPFEHAENLAAQERAVALMDTLGPDARRWAEVHRDIILRFGRFPHRNAVLGRDTTEAEQRFLASGGFAG